MGIWSLPYLDLDRVMAELQYEDSMPILCAHVRENKIDSSYEQGDGGRKQM